MSHRVVFTDPHQHTFEEELLSTLNSKGATFEARLCADEEETIAFCTGADAVLTSWTQITKRVIAAMPHCRIIARMGTGYDNINDRAAGELGIPVTNVPNFCTEEVANHALALLLACDRAIAQRDREMRRGEWNQFELVKTSRRLSGRVLGLIGFGAIGQAVAQRAAAFGLQIQYFDPFLKSPPPTAAAQQCDSLEQLLVAADFVSLHVALSPDTHHLMGARELQQMKKEAVLINTARGGVVCELELVNALREGEIAAAGLDVYEVEPLPKESPLRQMDNVVLSPHTAAHTVESMKELRRRVIEEVGRALQGEPLLHIVNQNTLATP